MKVYVVDYPRVNLGYQYIYHPCSFCTWPTLPALTMRFALSPMELTVLKPNGSWNNNNSRESEVCGEVRVLGSRAARDQGGLHVPTALPSQFARRFVGMRLKVLYESRALRFTRLITISSPQRLARDASSFSCWLTPSHFLQTCALDPQPDNSSGFF